VGSGTLEGWAGGMIGVGVRVAGDDSTGVVATFVGGGVARRATAAPIAPVVGVAEGVSGAAIAATPVVEAGVGAGRGP
jgi:hypothetical protein